LKRLKVPEGHNEQTVLFKELKDPGEHEKMKAGEGQKKLQNVAHIEKIRSEVDEFRKI
jgi:hypothetical protein